MLERMAFGRESTVSCCCTPSVWILCIRLKWAIIWSFSCLGSPFLLLKLEAASIVSLCHYTQQSIHPSINHTYMYTVYSHISLFCWLIQQSSWWSFLWCSIASQDCTICRGCQTPFPRCPQDGNRHSLLMPKWLLTSRWTQHTCPTQAVHGNYRLKPPARFPSGSYAYQQEDRSSIQQHEQKKEYPKTHTITSLFEFINLYFLALTM